MDQESREERFRRSLLHVMRVAETTRDLAIVSASALAELAVVCDDLAMRAGPIREQRYRDMAARLRERSRQQAAFVEWENEEIRRLFGDHAAPTVT
jgi:hypothetical protein